MSANFTHGGGFTRQKEYYSAWENICMIFSVALEGVSNLSVEFKRSGRLSGREGVTKYAAVALREMPDRTFWELDSC